MMILQRYEQRELPRNHANTYFYDERNECLYLGDCHAKCGGQWICCDSCKGWKCYNHLYLENDVDLNEYDSDYVNSIYFTCDQCLKLITDTIEIQKNYLKDFRYKYFGKDGVRSEKKIRESLDSKWIGLSIDVLMDHCDRNKWEQDTIKLNVLNDENVINEGKIQFLQLFNHYQEQCENTIFEDLFDYDNLSVIKSFVLLKKHMIRYILIHIPEYYDVEEQNISDKKLKLFKKQMFYFFDSQINVNHDYKQIKVLWNISVAKLRSESIVESICSILKKIYSPDRTRLKHETLQYLLQLRLLLPTSKKERDIVIKKVLERYHKLFPSQISHKITKAQKQKREKDGLSTSPTLDKAMKDVLSAFSLPFDLYCVYVLSNVSCVCFLLFKVDFLDLFLLPPLKFKVPCTLVPD